MLKECELDHSSISSQAAHTPPGRAAIDHMGSLRCGRSRHSGSSREAMSYASLIKHLTVSRPISNDTSASDANTRSRAVKSQQQDSHQ